MGRASALIAPVVDHMAMTLKQGSTRLYGDETTAALLDPARARKRPGPVAFGPCCATMSHCGAIGSSPMANGWNGPPRRRGWCSTNHPTERGNMRTGFCTGFDGTIQVPSHGGAAQTIAGHWILVGYTRLAKPDRKGGTPLNIAFCRAHGQRKLIAAKPRKGSPIVDEALLRIAALYKVEDAIRGTDPGRRRATRQELSRPLVDQFFAWLAAQGRTRLAQIRLGRGHSLNASPPERLAIVPRRRPHRH